MLIRLSILLATCVLSLTAEVSVDEKNDDNPFPKWLIDVGGSVNESDTAIYSTRRPRVTGKVRGGTICLNTEECGVGKCCLRRGKDPRRKCRRFQRIGQRCTDDQMMGGYYQNYCPCNRHSVCAVVGHVLKCVKRQPIQRPTTRGPRPQTPPQEEKESKESEEISTRPGAPPKNPTFNQTKLEFPEIPEFFKTFGTSETSLFPNEGEGGGEEGGGEEGEEEGEEAGKHGDDLPEDIVPQRGGTVGAQEPPEESNENDVFAAGSTRGSGARGAQQPSSHVSRGSRGNQIHPTHSRVGPAIAAGLPGENDIPVLPPAPV
uniref:Ixodegrin B n=1 Tax=Rhipicephalus pulchellus TaxID=72859 RepID=L7LSL6_RHIPC